MLACSMKGIFYDSVFITMEAFSVYVILFVKKYFWKYCSMWVWKRCFFLVTK